jgi:hypothetical protein
LVPKTLTTDTYQFATCVAKVSYRKFYSIAVGPLRADSSHLGNA